MHFPEDDTRAGDEDPEFTGTLPDTEEDDEFLSDDLPFADEDTDLSDDDDDESDLAADL